MSATSFVGPAQSLYYTCWRHAIVQTN